MRVLIVVKFLILYAFFDVATGTDCCYSEFKTRGYIPKYADGVKRTDLEVKYGKTPIKCGETVSLLSGSNRAPILKIDLPVDKCINVTVIAIGPGALVNPPYLFWLVQNIPTVALQKGWTNGGNTVDKLKGNNQGDVKAYYVTSKSPKEDLGTGNNTLIFFVYCQCRYISDIQPYERTDRIGKSFDIKSYAADHGLKCPVAGLFVHVSLTGLKPGQTVNVTPVNSDVNPGVAVSPVQAPPMSPQG